MSYVTDAYGAQLGTLGAQDCTCDLVTKGVREAERERERNISLSFKIKVK